MLCSVLEERKDIPFIIGGDLNIYLDPNILLWHLNTDELHDARIQSDRFI